MSDATRLQGLLDRFRQQLRLRGLYSATALAGVFRSADANGNGKLSSREFDAALRRCGIFLGLHDLNALVRAFNVNDGEISWDEFLTVLVGRMSPRRRAFIKSLFGRLDKDGSGQLTAIELSQSLDLSGHPDVRTGRKTASALVKEFIASVESGLGLPGDGQLSYHEFKEYYQQVSLAMPDDDLFIREMERLWGVKESDFGSASGEVERILRTLRDKLMQYTSGAGSPGASLLRAFNHMDLNGSGVLTRREFSSALERFGLVLSAEQFEVLWKAVDADASGGVNYKEFVTLVDSSTPVSGGPTAAAATSPAKPPAQAAPAANGVGQVAPAKPAAATAAAAAAAGPAAAAAAPAGGRKRALLIGINYIGHSQGRLQGCINDTKTMRRIITERFGFPRDGIRVLRDDDRSCMPTKNNILEAIAWLVSDSQPGDSLFFHYSGHGAQQRDDDGDEEDGMDETLVPCDYQRAGMIVDDELFEALVDKLDERASLFVVLDCCHSGTGMDLLYTYIPVGNALRKEVATKKAAKKPRTVMMLSGCQDSQTSADAQADSGEAAGAMTSAFDKVLTNTPNVTYSQLLLEMHKVLKAGRYTQKPQLSAESDFDINAAFTL